MTPKATRMQICIFDNFSKGITPGANTVHEAFAPVILDLKTKHGEALNIDLEYCDTTFPENAKIVQDYNFRRFPAVQIAAEYDDGEGLRTIGLSQDFGDFFTGVNWTPDDVRKYVEVFLYKTFGDNTLFCKLAKALGMPQLCAWEKWLWLGGAVLSAQQAVETTAPTRKAIYGASSAFSLWQFYRLGGVDDLKNLLNPKNPNNPTFH